MPRTTWCARGICPTTRRPGASGPSSCCRSGTPTRTDTSGLCRLLNRFKISALRLSLPYHDERKPPELGRADYIVSSNVGRTAQVCRQAVLDARRGVEWLASQGYESIGILGTSLGSCLAMLTAAHEPRLRAAALNHISPYFADVVWSGLSTDHVRQGLDGHIDLASLRRIWMPISPYPYLDRMRDKRLLLVYAPLRPDVPRRLVENARRTSSGVAESNTSSRCSPAGTTAPASVPSSGSTD